VGDSVEFDVVGAQAAGLAVALLASNGTQNSAPDLIVRSLRELAEELVPKHS